MIFNFREQFFRFYDNITVTCAQHTPFCKGSLMVKSTNHTYSVPVALELAYMFSQVVLLLQAVHA